MTERVEEIKSQEIAAEINRLKAALAQAEREREDDQDRAARLATWLDEARAEVERLKASVKNVEIGRQNDYEMWQKAEAALARAERRAEAEADRAYSLANEVQDVREERDAARAEVERLKQVVPCACGHDGKLTSDDCPLHGTASPPFSIHAANLALAERGRDANKAGWRAATETCEMLLTERDAARAEVERLERGLVDFNALEWRTRARHAEAALARVRAASERLLAELSDVQIYAVREGCGNTNANVLQLRMDELRAALEGRGSRETSCEPA